MDFYWGAVIVIFHGDQSQSAKSRKGRQKKKNLIIYGMEEVETSREELEAQICKLIYKTLYKD